MEGIEIPITCFVFVFWVLFFFGGLLSWLHSRVLQPFVPFLRLCQLCALKYDEAGFDPPARFGGLVPLSFYVNPPLWWD